MVLAAGFWLITYMTVWNTIRRQHLWRAVAPAGIVLLINMYYYGGHGGAGLLVSRLSVCGAVVCGPLVYSCIKNGVGTLAACALSRKLSATSCSWGRSLPLRRSSLAWSRPSLPVHRKSPVCGARSAARSDRLKTHSAACSPACSPTGLPYTNPFGRTLALLGQRNLGNELVLEVRSPEGRYWQGVIYDRYTGAAFQSSDTERISAAADEQALPQNFEKRDADYPNGICLLSE